eukprot:GHVO01033366.1.p1 GENE.GHVO01033366.1~~GHVO01033366.1.p1  ORF type:complete len:799 (+),score=134.98 GHVO01033366.1:182-2578(+)
MAKFQKVAAQGCVKGVDLSDANILPLPRRAYKLTTSPTDDTGTNMAGMARQHAESLERGKDIPSLPIPDTPKDREGSNTRPPIKETNSRRHSISPGDAGAVPFFSLPSKVPTGPPIERTVKKDTERKVQTTNDVANPEETATLPKTANPEETATLPKTTNPEETATLPKTANPEETATLPKTAIQATDSPMQVPNTGGQMRVKSLGHLYKATDQPMKAQASGGNDANPSEKLNIRGNDINLQTSEKLNVRGNEITRTSEKLNISIPNEAARSPASELPPYTTEYPPSARSPRPVSQLPVAPSPRPVSQLPVGARLFPGNVSPPPPIGPVGHTRYATASPRSVHQPLMVSPRGRARTSCRSPTTPRPAALMLNPRSTQTSPRPTATHDGSEAGTSTPLSTPLSRVPNMRHPSSGSLMPPMHTGPLHMKTPSTERRVVRSLYMLDRPKNQDDSLAVALECGGGLKGVAGVRSVSMQNRTLQKQRQGYSPDIPSTPENSLNDSLLDCNSYSLVDCNSYSGNSGAKRRSNGQQNSRQDPQIDSYQSSLGITSVKGESNNSQHSKRQDSYTISTGKPCLRGDSNSSQLLAIDSAVAEFLRTSSSFKTLGELPLTKFDRNMSFESELSNISPLIMASSVNTKKKEDSLTPEQPSQPMPPPLKIPVLRKKESDSFSPFLSKLTGSHIYSPLSRKTYITRREPISSLTRQCIDEVSSNSGSADNTSGMAVKNFGRRSRSPPEKDKARPKTSRVLTQRIIEPPSKPRAVTPGRVGRSPNSLLGRLLSPRENPGWKFLQWPKRATGAK